MASTDRRPQATSPLLVASVAYATGGVGSMAMAAHDGSAVGLALLRFGFGAIAAGLVLLFQRTRVSSTLRSPGSRWWLVVAAVTGAGAVIAVMAAAKAGVPVLVFTVLGALTPALVALGARFTGLGRATSREIPWALVSIAAACGVALAGARATDMSGVGVLLAVVSTFLAATSTVTAARSCRHFSPAAAVFWLCVAGVLSSVLLAVFGAEVLIEPSTVVVALFLALIPGGLAKAAIFWAGSVASPAMVEACAGIGVVTAAVGAWIWLGQSFTFVQAVCALVMLVAVVGLVRASPTLNPALEAVPEM